MAILSKPAVAGSSVYKKEAELVDVLSRIWARKAACQPWHLSCFIAVLLRFKNKYINKNEKMGNRHKNGTALL